MIPAWNALPLWAKIVLFPVLVSAAVTILVTTTLVALGVMEVITGMFGATTKWFRNTRKGIAEVTQMGA